MSGAIKSISKPIAGLLGMDMEPERRQVKESTSLIEQQQRKERSRLAEETSELEKKKALMRRGGAGRSLLIRTSPTGVAQSDKATTLGGA